MNNLIKKLLMSAMGLVLVLGWWTLEDKITGGPKVPAAVDKVPAKVWEGGGTVLTIETESSDPAVLRAYFEATSKNKDGSPVRSLDSYEKIPAGKHTWTVDVPATVGGDIEFQADNAKPGSRLKWTVRSNNKILADEFETLKDPLQGNEAFFLRYEADDFSGDGDQ